MDQAEQEIRDIEQRSMEAASRRDEPALERSRSVSGVASSTDCTDRS